MSRPAVVGGRGRPRNDSRSGRLHDAAWIRRCVWGWWILGLVLGRPEGRAQDADGHAPGWPVTVRHWHADHGLPQNSVQALCQTRGGYLWVGTRFGLARFDGLRFRELTVAGETVPLADSVCAIAEAPDDAVWVGTLRGLLRWKNGQLVRHPTPAGDRVWAVWPETDRVVWLGLGQGIGRLTLDGQLEIYRPPSQAVVAGQVRSLVPFGPGELLLTTLEGAWKFQLADRSFQKWVIPAPTPRLEDRMHSPSAREWQVVPWTPESGRTFSEEVFLPRQGFRSANSWGPRLLPDAGQGWWVLDARRRVFRLDDSGPRRWPPRTGGLMDDVLCVLRDRDDGVWMGTVAHGLLRLRVPVCQTFTVGSGDDAAVFTVTGAPDGSVWAASRSNLVRFRGGRMEWVDSVRGGLSDQVTALLPDGQGGLWVGRDRGGLWRWHQGVWSNRTATVGLPPEARVRSLFQSRDGTLWVGTRNGLFCTGPDGNRRFGTAEGLSRADVGALHEDREGSLWVGTDRGGVARFEGGRSRLRVFSESDGLAGDTVWGFHEDRLGALWMLGTHGLTRRYQGRMSKVTRREGLYDDLNNQMFEDADGHFWFGCNRGVYRVEAKALHRAADGKGAVECAAFGVADGLAVAETNGEGQPAGWQGADGVLWFPSPAGVLRVDPSRVAHGNRPPPVLIEEARTESLPLADSSGVRSSLRVHHEAMVIPPGAARVLEIHYTANSFAAPERVRFRHRLVGQETNWVEAGTRRVAYYSNLGPGRYRFEVTACNDHGVWNPVPATMSFELEPFWHQTGTFRMAAVLAIVGLGLAAHRLRIRAVRRRAGLEGELELARERERIARDMHDDVGAGLTQIGFLTARASRTPPGELRPWLERIADASRDTAQAVDEIVWAVNPGNDRLEPLANYICQFAREYLEPSQIQCRLDIPPLLPDRAVPSDTRHHLLMVLKESLSNVVRHSGAREVTVSLRLSDSDDLTLRVQDDGCGLIRHEVQNVPLVGSDGNGEGHPHPGSSGNGLANLRRRAGLIGGRCEVRSTPGTGTTVEVCVPLGDSPRGSTLVPRRGRPPG